MKKAELSGHISAFLTILVWGVTFISTKILLRDYTPLAILVMRFLLGWAALWLLHPHVLKIADKKTELIFAAAGFTGVTLYFLLENIALTCTLASNVAIIVTTSPFFTAILAWRFLKAEKPDAGFYIGFILAMSGVSLISANGIALELNPAGDILALLAAISWAVYSILTRRLTMLGYASLPATRRIFFYGLLFMLPLVAMFPFSTNPAILLKPQNLGNLLFLGIFASAICFASWTFSLKRLGAARASVYIYLVPVVTVFTAAIVLGEQLTMLEIAGASLTIGGLIMAEIKFPVFRHLRIFCGSNRTRP